MNVKAIALLPLCVAVTTAHAFLDVAKLGVLVLDESTGLPVKDVLVRGGFENYHGWLAVKGAPPPNEDFVRTDADGRCTVRGRTNNGEAGAAVEEAPSGYYCPYFGEGFTFRRKNILGIWQPDSLVVTIRLQRVEHPIPLFVKNAFLSGGRGVFPVGANAIRYDLMEGDWLPPVGKGKVADVEFIRHPTKRLYEVEKQMLNRDTNKLENRKYVADRDVMSVRFPGDGNGLTELHPSPGQRLQIRTAPETGYVPTYECWRQTDYHDRGSFVSRDNTESYDKRKCFCFRIRTQRDEKGRVVKAFYGKIYRDISFDQNFTLSPSQVASAGFFYYLNPRSLDRNLEWDMKSNLCPNPGELGNIGDRDP